MPLPLEDPLVAALPATEREAIGEVWHLRATSELLVGAQFSLLARGFVARLANRDLSARLERAAADEDRHSQLCQAVSAEYAARPQPAAPSALVPLARFGDADEAQSLLLQLVLLSCINEGTSTFYLRSAMKHSRSVLARAALRELLADDVRHARLGWMHLASPLVGAADKRLVSAALPTLLGLSHESWTSVAPRHEPWFTEHGCPGAAVAERAFEDALRELVVPGMAHVGVDPAPASRWVQTRGR